MILCGMLLCKLRAFIRLLLLPARENNSSSFFSNSEILLRNYQKLVHYILSWFKFVITHECVRRHETVK